MNGDHFKKSTDDFEVKCKMVCFIIKHLFLQFMLLNSMDVYRQKTRVSVRKFFCTIDMYMYVLTELSSSESN